MRGKDKRVMPLLYALAFFAVTENLWSKREHALDSYSLHAAVAADIRSFNSDSVKKFLNWALAELLGSQISPEAAPFPKKSETFCIFSFTLRFELKMGGSMSNLVNLRALAGYLSRFCCAIWCAAARLKSSTNWSRSAFSNNEVN